MKIQPIFGDFVIIDDLNIDNKKVESYCYDIQSNDPGITVTNRYGYHSSNIKVFEPIDELCSAIINSANNGKKLIGLSDKVGLQIKESWVNINTKGSWMESHNHGNNFLTGVYYVKVPANSGDICFHKSGDKYSKDYIGELTEFTRETIKVSPKEGQLILFPPWLMHSVEKSESNDTRISIAFNLAIKKQNMDFSYIEQRKNICNSCPKKKAIICFSCGCIIEAKIRLKTEKCPEGKW